MTAGLWNRGAYFPSFEPILPSGVICGTEVILPGNVSRPGLLSIVAPSDIYRRSTPGPVDNTLRLLRYHACLAPLPPSLSMSHHNSPLSPR